LSNIILPLLLAAWGLLPNKNSYHIAGPCCALLARQVRSLLTTNCARCGNNRTVPSAFLRPVVPGEGAHWRH